MTTEQSLNPETQKQAKIRNVINKKRLIVCCDGTWNELTSYYPTNVVKFARSVKYTAADQTPQLVFYLSGCGTENDHLIDRIGGGAFGWGIDEIIQDAYRLLCMNYDADAQDDIYLIGFSRGAYIVRCLAGMIYKSGLLRRSKILDIPKAYDFYRNSKIKPNDPKAHKFREDNSQKIEKINFQKDYLKYRVPIKMLGCWDTVGALGIPDIIPWLPIAKLWNKKYEFYDATLSPIVENAFHAVAIDEKRKVFPSTSMDKNEKNPDQIVEQVLFVGEHACIGGGTKEYRGLSDYPFEWMLNKATKLGLDVYDLYKDETDEEFKIKPDPNIQFDNSVTGIYMFGGEEWRPIKPRTLIHHSVKKRINARPDYRPLNLNPILKYLLRP
ncbi:DUF2235 domain-containing protein [Desmonostoc muscorum LEGE 12446]|uniref:DUF2235 domain-containing protein n=1 Tax=Desmonostoc muscorum LEGE 12446 TaxID=1828758 RepID=A0A8J7D140_DESMC|nr:DUF2235 domain-containing protein [Desmonostoc muscorum]MCF2150428.1 DUF2235 domain-containing protein [Desmonostoc muscorum LEGE 12446]